MPDLDKLRRFGIAIALILITYTLSGAELKTPAEFKLFGWLERLECRFAALGLSARIILHSPAVLVLRNDDCG